MARRNTAFDAPAFGTERGTLFSILSEVAVTCVLKRNDVVVGHAMRRKFGPGHVIGPIVALNDADAIQMAAWHLRSLEGKQTRIDTREKGPFADFLTAGRLNVSETTTTMSEGREFLNRAENKPWIYGLAGHALS